MAETNGQKTLNFPLQVRERLQAIASDLYAISGPNPATGSLADIQYVSTASQAIQSGTLTPTALTAIQAALTAATTFKAQVDAAIAAIPVPP